MLGSLSQYRALLKKHVFPNRPELPDFAHGIAGMGAGATVSFIAAPVEHVKARLQVQYHGRKTPTPASSSSSSVASTTTSVKPRYSGPIDCTRQLLSQHGIRGLYHGLSATLFFRSFFFFWWSSYAVLTRELRNRTSLSEGAINFWAGGLSAQVFWLTCYPSDVVKQRIMTDDLDNRRYRNWMQAAKAVYKDAGWRGYWR